MAGIGFELRRMIRDEGDLLSRVRGYASAGLVAAGPWIMTIITLSIVTVFAPFFADRVEYEAFRALVTYGFAFSLVVVGVVQMSFTRRIADLLFAKRYERVLPAFAAAFKWTAVVQVVIGVFFAIVSGMSASLALVSVALYVIMSLTWVALLWLSATKDFNAVLWAYAKGSLLSLLAMAVLGFNILEIPGLGGTAALIAGYAAGQGLTLALLVVSIVREMDVGGVPDNSILMSMKTYPRLVLIGLFYNAGIWIDQIVFWSADGVSVLPLVNIHPMYDTCRFFAYLTVMPALVMNLVLVETDFYEGYRSFYGSILHDFPLKEVHSRKTHMLETLRWGTIRLVRMQGAVTFAVLIFAPQIVAMLGLPPDAAPVFRACCLGSFFHVLLLVTVLILLYFDLRAEALVTAGIFLMGNAVLAFWSLDNGTHYYGVGYAIASLMGLAVGYLFLYQRSAVLEFLAFTKRPAADIPPKDVPEQFT
ncbi:MAG: exopolysaccharide Pel transporter PelG [Planctomycetota bacterium]|nr:exopolysaccharide Pel transporter PelG [Planctomycetota bacterium]